MPLYKLDKTKNGLTGYRVFVSYQDASGKYCKRSKIVYGKTEAMEYEEQLRKECAENPTHTAMTIATLVDEYLIAKQPDVKLSSFIKTRTVLQKAVLPYLSDIKLSKLNIHLLQDWKNQVAALPFSQRTKRNYYSEFRTLLNYAVKMHYISSNPLSELGNFKSVAVSSATKIRYYTVDQFKQFIAAAKNIAEERNTILDWSYYVLFNILFYMGLRKGEAYALKFSDIDGDIMHISRSITQKLGCGDIETVPKTPSSIRSIKIPAPLLDIINEHKKRIRLSSDRFTDEFRICPVRDSSVTNKNVQIATLAQLPHITIHEFRHSHATFLIMNGVNVQQVAKRLGHHDATVTMQVYAHLYPSEEDKAIKILSQI